MSFCIPASGLILPSADDTRMPPSGLTQSVSFQASHSAAVLTLTGFKASAMSCGHVYVHVCTCLYRSQLETGRPKRKEERVKGETSGRIRRKGGREREVEREVESEGESEGERETATDQIHNTGQPLLQQGCLQPSNTHSCFVHLDPENVSDLFIIQTQHALII